MVLVMMVKAMVEVILRVKLGICIGGTSDGSCVSDSNYMILVVVVVVVAAATVVVIKVVVVAVVVVVQLVILAVSLYWSWKKW